MKRLRFLTTVMAVVFALSNMASADDGDKVLKNMTGPENITPDVTITGHPPEAEHAFSGMMKFYVPTQRANGTVEAVEYYNVDGVLIDTRELAKPLINVFIYGPALGVDGTAFAHSFMDTYAAVSLDDGETWKKTNLSESAKLTSFNLTSHVAAEPLPMPADHHILIGSKNNGAFHAPVYDQPYTAHCSECHGPALTGTTQAPSCYSCHGSRWKEEPFNSVGPIVYEAIYKNNKLEGSGENADPFPEVEIIDGLTGDVLFTENVTNTGTFSFTEKVGGKPPCTIAARIGDERGPAIPVTDKRGEPLDESKKECTGLGVDLTEYPGGSYNVFHAVAGNKVLVAWPSRFCEQGQPNFSLDSEDAILRRSAIAVYLGIDLGTASSDDLYLVDMFRVAGNQGSIDFADEAYPQAGIVPFGCVWTARGELVAGDDPRTDSIEASYMRWFNAERLTSGRRSPNRIEVMGVEGAGFAITWQEDPEGLRPGQGLGPGEGWSGAVAHSQTDVWYSYIDWENFDIVQDPTVPEGTVPMTFAEYTTAAAGDITQKPKPFVPFSMPMPITDNAKCNVDNPAPYCYGTALDGTVDAPTDSLGNELIPLDYGMKDMCYDTVEVPTGPNDNLQPVCVPANGTPLVGNTAATRARLNLFGYDSDGDTVTDSAFVVVQMEEDKGLGKALYIEDEFGLPTDSVCSEAEDDAKLCVAWDIGKNQWYHTFSMSLTDDLALDPTDGLVSNLTFHGHMLNQPEINWTTGEFFPVKNTADIWDFVDYNFDLYSTEIARRGSLLAQGIVPAIASEDNLIALPTWKQGQMRQGGPADVMSRRIVIPENWKVTDGNPYAFRNMVCDGVMLYTDGSNPYYPGGLCMAPAINMSATIPDSAIDSADGSEAPLPVITDGSSDTNPILRGLVQGEGDTTKILTWHQCPSDSVVVSQTDGTADVVQCLADDSTFEDQSWYNPYEVAKGHRGFLDGDFVMMLYAWSPNWRLNAVGHDRYELYIRRSFDGAQSWTTLPAPFAASDGVSYSGGDTVTCETYRTAEQQQQGESTEPRVCYTYAAGDFEQARNVTQHLSMSTTTLDPRYAKTSATITADPFLNDIPNYDLESGSEDVRDPSRYFIVFETGDNKTVEVGEAEPLDLFYSRAVSFGDDYQVWAEEDDLSICYPSDPHGDDKVPLELIDSGFCNEFDQMEQGTPGLAASEASLTANPGGEFLYGVWSEISEDTHESNARARRVWWIDDYISDTEAWDFGQGPSAGE